MLVERLFAEISEISTLPHIALCMLRLVNDPKSTATDLVEVIETDPAFATRVLRTVNASFFGLQQSVVSLDHAVVLLGFREIQNLALTAHVASLFEKTTGHGRYSRRNLWLHMVSVAAVARHIARHCGDVAPDGAYLAGLLHDVGLILLDQALHGPFCQVLDALEESRSIAEVEEEILGFGHAALGHYVLKKWGIQESIAQAAACHHRPQIASSENRRLVSVVALANTICHRMGIHSLGAAVSQPAVEQTLEILGVTKADVATIIGNLPAQLDTARELAGLSLDCANA